MNSTSIQISSGSELIRISTIYRRPQILLDINDLNVLTSGCDWFVVAGGMNAKHPLWHSRVSNAAGIVLINHVSLNDYVLIAPGSPTHFPNYPTRRPDVLDIAQTRIPMLVHGSNPKKMSSDPILMELSNSPVSVFPPVTSQPINWKKFNRNLSENTSDISPNTTSKFEFNRALNKLTKTIQSTVDHVSMRPLGIKIKTSYPTKYFRR